MKRPQYQRRKVKPEKNTWYVNITNQHKHICTVIFNQESHSEIQPLIAHQRWFRLFSFQRNHLVVQKICIPLNFLCKSVKLMFSKKATKLDKIFTVNLTLCGKCQIDGEDLVNFCGLHRKHELYHHVLSPFNFAVHGHAWITNMQTELRYVQCTSLTKFILK